MLVFLLLTSLVDSIHSIESKGGSLHQTANCDKNPSSAEQQLLLEQEVDQSEILSPASATPLESSRTRGKPGADASIVLS